MDKYLNILNLVNENQLPDSFDYGSKEIHIILNLIDEGLISAKVEPVYGSTLVYSARLTMKGEKKLKASKLSTKILVILRDIFRSAWTYILSVIAAILIAFLTNNLNIIEMLFK